MISCRYVGSDCSMIGEREFDAVGQRAELSEQGFREAVLGGAAFIVEEDFKKVGFTEEELRDFGPSGLRADPPVSFVEKLYMAQRFYFDTCARLTKEGSRVLSEVQELEPA